MSGVLKRLIPRSMIGRTLMILALGIIASHLIATALFWEERRTSLTTMGGRHIAERVASAIVAMEQTPSEVRPRTARRFSGPGFRVAWSSDPDVTGASLSAWQVRLVSRSLSDYLGEIAPDRLRVAYFKDGLTAFPLPEDEMSHRHMRGMMGHYDPFVGHPAVEVSYRLDDGSWLNIQAPILPISSFWRSNFFGAGLLSVLLVAGVVVWAASRSARPLALFTRAAERLGRDVDAPPMPVEGPPEVQKAARAFNDMQNRLQSFVRDRTRMLAAISHDLRTPITRLRLRAEFIDDAEQRAKVLSDLDEMEAMIAATLSFAKDDAAGEAGVWLDLSEIVASVVEDAREGGSNVTHRGPDSLSFNGRPIALKRALTNLVDNAGRYADKTEVTLEDGPTDVTIRVFDDGPGIPNDMLERVFDAFVRVEGSRSRETGGVGLGLAAVRTIAHAHGGEVSLANRADGGLEVELVLPKAVGA